MARPQIRQNIVTLAPKPQGPLTAKLREAERQMQLAQDLHRGCPTCFREEIDPFGEQPVCAMGDRVADAYRELLDARQMFNSKRACAIAHCQDEDEADSVLAHTEI